MLTLVLFHFYPLHWATPSPYSGAVKAPLALAGVHTIAQCHRGCGAPQEKQTSPSLCLCVSGTHCTVCTGPLCAHSIQGTSLLEPRLDTFVHAFSSGGPQYNPQGANQDGCTHRYVYYISVLQHRWCPMAPSPLAPWQMQSTDGRSVLVRAGIAPLAEPKC